MVYCKIPRMKLVMKTSHHNVMSNKLDKIVHILVCGSLLANGVKVTRERVRSTLKSIDPLGGLRRFPAGLVRRNQYSVVGPNSLWHIGKLGVD